MYQLVSAIAQLHAPASPWVVVDLSTLSISDIDNKYADAYLRVSNPLWAKDRTMRFREITQGYLQRTDTLDQFFTANANNTLANTNGLATIVKGKIKYADAFWAGYQLSRGLYSSNPTTIAHPDEADTLIMKKTGVDARIFHKNCLVSINGLIHLCDADSDYIYVIDAGKTNYYSRRNEVGIINFKDIGEISYHPISADMLHRGHPDQPFANQIYIKAKEPSLDKTVALVMGGYLFLLDNLTFFRTSDDLFCLDTQSIALLDRFYESRKIIDLSVLGIDYNGMNDAQISKEQLFSDEVLTRWLTMSQSFLLYIDNTNIDVERQQLAPTLVAKQYLSYEEPTLPLVSGFGLIEPYWVQEDDNVFSVTIGDNVRPEYLFHKTPSVNAPMPADNRIPYHRESYSRAHFLNVTSEKIVIVPNS